MWTTAEWFEFGGLIFGLLAAITGAGELFVTSGVDNAGRCRGDRLSEWMTRTSTRLPFPPRWSIVVIVLTSHMLLVEGLILLDVPKVIWHLVLYVGFLLDLYLVAVTPLLLTGERRIGTLLLELLGRDFRLVVAYAVAFFGFGVCLQIVAFLLKH